MDNCTVICFFPWIHSFSQVFFIFLFVVDWNNKEDGTYNASLRGIVINAQILMVCPGSKNETLTAVKFQHIKRLLRNVVRISEPVMILGVAYV